MKTSISILVLIFAQISIWSQESCSNILIDFEDSQKYIKLDSLTDLWQIGIPNKEIFNQSYSGQNVIATNLNNSYPSSTHSYFQIKAIDPGNLQNQTYLSFRHKYDIGMDADSGFVSFSIDGGQNWNNILTNQFHLDFGDCYEESFFHHYRNEPNSTNPTPPFFQGIQTDWVKEYYVFNWWFGVKKSSLNPDPCTPDSILFRFNFVSDSFNDDSEGWMIDDLLVEWDFIGDINTVKKESIEIYPNPFRSYLEINNTHYKSLEIIDISGRIIETYRLDPFEKCSLNTERIINGIYIIRLIGLENQSQTIMIRD